MEPDKFAWRRLTCVLTTLVSLAVGCSSSESGRSDAGSVTEGCQGAACPDDAPPIDWSDPDPKYKAYLRVTDAAGRPIEGATVSVGELRGTTDIHGRVAFGPLSASAAVQVRIEKPGMTPQLVEVSPFNAGRTTQNVPMRQLDVSGMVDAEKPLSMVAGQANLQIPPRALAPSDGVRASTAKVELAFVSRQDAAALLPAGTRAINERGMLTVFEPDHVLFVRFRDGLDRQLNLAPGSVAMLELPVADPLAKEGDELGLWALNESTGVWQKESTCRVRLRPAGAASERSCVGAVSHFSWWSTGVETKVYEPNSLGCVTTATHAEPGACFDISLGANSVLQCNAQGEECTYYGSSFWKSAGRQSDLKWCGVLPVDAARTYRAMTVYEVSTDRCTENAPAKGRRIKVTGPVDFTSFQAMLGSDLMLNFTLNRDRDCPNLCAQLPLVITRADLDSPIWADQDGDGAFPIPATGDASIGLEAELRKTFGVFDCDDKRNDIYPRRPEPFCVHEDVNCDGKVNMKFTSHADVDPYRWNGGCKTCEEILGDDLPLTAEVPGNLYDEDCDTFLDDRDSDGFVDRVTWVDAGVLPDAGTTSDAGSSGGLVQRPGDCADGDKDVNPDKVEIPGNGKDDDCDGIWLDADADGYFAPLHLPVADALKLDPRKFTDCDDHDSSIHPGISDKEERAVLADLYYEKDGVRRRKFWFCSYFEEGGRPNWLFRQTTRDRNCDGKRATDLDGDGFTALDDTSLGQAYAIDCDDLDPRNAPVSLSDPDSCMVRADHPNDSVCDVESRTGAEGCPILTLSGTDLVTACQEITNVSGLGTGRGACAYAGWWDRNPLVPNAGVTWGACDGQGPLPDCPRGASCAGRLAYTEEFKSFIERTYLDGGALAFPGMCYPDCDLSKVSADGGVDASTK